jgi:hypothetical protein
MSTFRWPWPSQLSSIVLVLLIALPTTAPFQVVDFGDAVTTAAQRGVTAPSRVPPRQILRNETDVSSWRGQESRVRHRARSGAGSGRISTVDHARVPASLRRTAPDLSRPADRQLTVLRI